MKTTPNPSYSITIKLNDVEEINTILIDACHELKWKIISNVNNQIQASTSTSLNPWGETITIIINQTQIDFISSSNGNQLLDWGKNKSNLKKITDILYNKIGNHFIDYSSNFKDSKSNTVSAKQNPQVTLISILKPSKTYLVTPLLLLLNIIVFIFVIFDGASFIFPNAEKVIEWGANDRTLTINGEPWRLITCLFVHIGIIHLVLNLIAILFVGSILEPLIGKTKVLIAFLVTGILAVAVSSIWYTFTINAGASPSIYGLFGVLIALLTTNNVSKSIRLPVLISIILYTGLSIIISFLVGFDFVANSVGLFSGLIVGYIFYYGIITKEVKTNLWIHTSIIFLGLSFSFLIMKEIPNPIKKYNTKSKNKVDYFKLYQKKMKDFETNETLAIEVFTHHAENKEAFLDFIMIELFGIGRKI
ncbi:MAG: rhomboid family intramembrane serine protease [Flavobacterium sp.]|nr:rhomboid family intramembrane serine protease [Flavobacterium sp.]